MRISDWSSDVCSSDLFDHVCRIGVHLVAGISLGRAAMATAVMGDDAIALFEEEHHLGVPVIGAERPAMVEHDGLRGLRTPVLVENLGTVLGGDIAAHGDRKSVL